MNGPPAPGGAEDDPAFLPWKRMSTILVPLMNPKNVSAVVPTVASRRFILLGFNANSPKQFPEPSRTISFSMNSPYCCYELGFYGFVVVFVVVAAGAVVAIPEVGGLDTGVA